MTSLFAIAGSLNLINRFVRNVFPLVEKELVGWRQAAAEHCEPRLAAQALASIRDKKFHCQGGSIFSLYENVDTPAFVRLVVSLQTISDYLDNLCDRSGIISEEAFRQLHLAMTDALDPSSQLGDYYRFYQDKEDNGYLVSLVAACRQEVARLPSYPVVQTQVLKLARLYSDLQTYKHLDPTLREARMAEWGNKYLADFPDISLWEFAAAAGSTLGIFVLCAAASARELTTEIAEQIFRGYFPWICGLHILLDYFIDQAEDREHGDLNFVAYYANELETFARLQFFYRQAHQKVLSLPHPIFHQAVIDGLLAMYLSDPKTDAPAERAITDSLLAAAGRYPRLLLSISRLLRRRKIL